MTNDTYFWYSADFTSFYIDPITTDTNLPIILEKVVGVETIIPSDTDAMPVVSPLLSSQLQGTPYEKMLNGTYGQFLRKHAKDIYEYTLILENNMIISNLGYGIQIENTSASYINRCISKVLGKMIDVEALEPQRFYRINDSVIYPTEHITDDAVSYVAGLFIPEIFT